MRLSDWPVLVFKAREAQSLFRGSIAAFLIQHCGPINTNIAFYMKEKAAATNGF